jgi:60S ribosome subunit biogenesis protein NIP7
MRPLTEEETKTMFTKLSHYIGNNIVHLVDREDTPHVFRLHRDRVYYASEVSHRIEALPWLPFSYRSELIPCSSL